MDGLSVITPCYKCKKYIHNLLDSLKKQKLSYDLFEHVITINGELDGTTKIIEDFKEKNPNMNIRIIYSDIANASNARNIAIDEANRKYSTMIDADDYVSSNYLKELYAHASENRIVIGSFFDVEKNTGKISHSYVTPELLNNYGIVKDPYNRIPHVLVLNACKLIPSSILKKQKFNINLHSGEDIELFCRLITLYDLEYYVLSGRKRAVYYRVLRSNSISRKEEISFKFNVLERLKVIKKLNDLLFISDNKEKERFIQSKIVAQCTFIHNYVSTCPNEIELVREAIRKEKLNYFSYQEVNRDLAKKLVISRNFPSDMGTSGIKERMEIIDIIHVNMEEISEIPTPRSEEHIDQNLLITTPYSYDDWNGIKLFCGEGMKKLILINRKKGEYEEIYSGSKFPASHFLAFEYKIKHPDVKWIAEFSEPLSYGSGEPSRYSKINDPQFMYKVNELLYNLCCPKYEGDNLFFLSEYLPYVFADEIVFTNTTGGGSKSQMK